ncbi:MAG: hypothetical protein WCK11_02990 [Candidatus Falkowbacteria bacterium]
MKKKILLVIFSAILLLNSASSVLALEPIVNTAANKYDNGDYTILDMVDLFVRGSKFMFAILASLTLLFIVYGGLVLVLSGGVSEKVNKGKQIITGALVGMVIVLCSYAIIYTVLDKIQYKRGANTFNTVKQ